LYPSPDEAMVTIEVRDLAGRLVYTFKESVNKGYNVIYIQSLPDWIQGVYFIIVKNKEDVRQGKLIKVR